VLLLAANPETGRQADRETGRQGDRERERKRERFEGVGGVRRQ
jgi:hypothetical protein